MYHCQRKGQLAPTKHDAGKADVNFHHGVRFWEPTSTLIGWNPVNKISQLVVSISAKNWSFWHHNHNHLRIGYSHSLYPDFCWFYNVSLLQPIQTSFVWHLPLAVPLGELGTSLQHSMAMLSSLGCLKRLSDRKPCPVLLLYWPIVEGFL